MYFILLLILYPISLLPLWILYPLSDGICFILYRVFGYRRKIVLDNLKQSFPEKSDAEIKLIMNKFYHSFCDQWIETLKLLSMPMSAISKRVKGNWIVMNELFDEGKNVYALLGHQFNWEWGNIATQLHSKAQFAGIYLPQNSKAIDQLTLKIRARSGSMLIPANNMRPAFSQLKTMRYHIIGFMADQTPANLDIADWYSFMNRPTPFFKAPEKSARLAKAAVVFVGLRKIKRGYYTLIFTKITDDASIMQKGEITKLYVEHLTSELQKYPENWMWTHRRWKREMPEEVKVNN